MFLPKASDVKQLLRPYYAVNILLSIAFLVTKGTFLCDYVFLYADSCEIDSREREILLFLAVIVLFKGRKAANWMAYMSNYFMFAKLANVCLFFRADLILGIVYGLLCLVQMVLFPEPVFDGPENVTYFQGSELYDELTKGSGVTWVIEFYASWNPDCRHIAPIFASLSDRLTLPNLRFGKLDVGRWPNECNRFYVNGSAMSKQLPTICVFNEGKEVVRRPIVNNQKVVPFVFNEENCIRDLGLWELHAKCTESMAKRRTNKKNK